VSDADKGPLAAVVVTGANANGNEAEHRALAKTGGEQTESAIGELHGLLANITVALVVAHFFGVVVASVVHNRESCAGDDHRQKTPRARVICSHAPKASAESG